MIFRNDVKPLPTAKDSHVVVSVMCDVFVLTLTQAVTVQLVRVAFKTWGDFTFHIKSLTFYISPGLIRSSQHSNLLFRHININFYEKLTPYTTRHILYFTSSQNDAKECMFAASEEPDVKRLIHTTNPRESKSIIEAQDPDEIDFFARSYHKPRIHQSPVVLGSSSLSLCLESEPTCNDSESTTPPVVVRYCVNPSHVKVLDEEANIYQESAVVQWFEFLIYSLGSRVRTEKGVILMRNYYMPSSPSSQLSLNRDVNYTDAFPYNSFYAAKTRKIYGYRLMLPPRSDSPRPPTAEVISMIEDRTHSPQDLARIREYKKQKEKEAKERKEREREPADETRYTRHR
ncbi:hypothetical protein YC2023_033807 [Brassica napus]